MHYEHDGLAKILRKPLIGAVAARLAQADEIRIFQSTLIYKPPIAGEPSNIVPWHFDKHYWSSSSSERMLTAFIPFHDCPPEMGTITMVDGSHRWKEIGSDDTVVRHFAERDRSQLDQMLAENAAYNGAEVVKIPIIIPRGHMNFHHCRTYHGSGANVSDRPRRAISLHLQDGGQPLPRVPALRRHPGGVQPRRPGPPDLRRAARLRRPRLLPDPLGRPLEGEQHMSRYDWGQTHPGIERLEKAVTEARDRSSSTRSTPTSTPTRRWSPSWSTTSSRSGTSCPC